MLCCTRGVRARYTERTGETLRGRRGACGGLGVNSPVRRLRLRQAGVRTQEGGPRSACPHGDREQGRFGLLPEDFSSPQFEKKKNMQMSSPEPPGLSYTLLPSEGKGAGVKPKLINKETAADPAVRDGTEQECGLRE
ncbi:hypothetical protein NDU88_005920 [Pleurodeles waltl]|uniref:Uncharacterized protein n=1 Tax=Pleurodeles waltl TaxID=8319 RepID=A0AAV7N1J4_PLEWA|nr:hypothetical protein NDU88_005920 [Pleurodeles waltl]